MVVKQIQLENAEFPMVFTLLGMVTEVRLLQLEYLQVFFYQLFTS